MSTIDAVGQSRTGTSGLIAPRVPRRGRTRRDLGVEMNGGRRPAVGPHPADHLDGRFRSGGRGAAPSPLWPKRRNCDVRMPPSSSMSKRAVKSPGIRHNLAQLVLDVRAPRLVSLFGDSQLAHETSRADVAAQNDQGPALGAPIAHGANTRMHTLAWPIRDGECARAHLGSRLHSQSFDQWRNAALAQTRAVPTCGRQRICASRARSALISPAKLLTVAATQGR